jgi:hypothetical protein
MAKNSLVFSVSADIRKFSTGMQNVSRQLKKVSKDMRNIGKNMSTYITAPLSLMGVGAVKAAADFEKLRVSLRTSFQGNEKAAKNAFDRINQFTANTPFQLEEVTQAFLTLKNMGLDPSTDALTSYGNTAASMGKDLQQMVEAVADAATGEFERLKEFGIKAKSQGDNVSFTFQGVTTTVKKNSAEIEQYLQNIGNVNFAGGIEAQSKTFYGQLSTLQDNLKLIAADFGELILPILQDFIGIIQKVIARFKELDPNTKKIIIVISGLAAAIGPVLMAISAMIPAIGAIGTAISVATGPIGIAVAAIGALGAAAIYVYENWEALKEFLTDWDRIKNALIDFVKFVGKRVILPIYDALKMLGLDVITDPIDAMFNKLDALKNPVSEIKTEFKSFGQTMKDFATETVFGMENVTAAAETMNSALMSTTSGGSGGGMEQETAIGPMAMKESGPLGLPTPDEMREINTEMMRYAETANEVADAQISASEAGYTMGQVIGNSISSVIKGTKTMGQAIAEAIKGIIQAFVAKAIAALAADSIAKGGWFGLIAAATAPMVVGSLFDSIMPKFASGGIVSGPTMGMMGEYPGARSNPEVIAPLSKLKGMMGGGSGYLYSHIRGNDIYLSNERELRIRDYET